MLPRPTTAQTPRAHAFTVDVEAWFHAHNLAVPSSEWDSLPIRLDEPIDWLLAELAATGNLATFFILGWVAERRPDLVHRIRDAGHEIASHGYGHVEIGRQNRAEFARDIADSKAILEDITGCPVSGYRAPSYSIGPDTIWALNELAELGFEYDSSIYPVRSPHGRYGMTGVPLKPFRLANGLWEFPLPTLSILGHRIPAATGGYFRHLPAAMTRLAFAQNTRAGGTVVLNVHPWELDSGQPKRAASVVRNVMHYGNISTSRRKLAEVLRAFNFQSILKLLKEMNAAALVFDRSVPVSDVRIRSMDEIQELSSAPL